LIDYDAKQITMNEYRQPLSKYHGLLGQITYPMKKCMSITLLLILAFSVSRAQWINTLIVKPANPTTADNIQVIVDAMFPSAGCSDWYIAGQSQLGSDFHFDVVNCIGMLSVICYNYDTIDMGNLAAGSYAVMVRLNAGSGSAPCSPSYQWRSDTVYFSVSPWTGIHELQKDNGLHVYPNPALAGRCTISLSDDICNDQQLGILISDMNGRTVKCSSVPAGSNELLINGDLQPGIYMIRITGAARSVSPVRLVVMNDFN
jgi:hypothetical protein